MTLFVKKRHNSMGNVPTECKQTVIDLFEADHKPSDIAKQFENIVNRHDIYRIISKYKETGSIKNRSKQKKGKFSEEMKTAMKSMYENDR